MCTESMIRLYGVAITMIKSIISIYMLINGLIMMMAVDLQQAFGTYMEGVGFGILLLGNAQLGTGPCTDGWQ